MVEKEAELKGYMLRGLDGDPDAWRLLLRELRAALTPFFKRRLIGREADAEDLVQDCLISIHAKRASYDRSLPVTTWVYAIARYKLIDHFRKLGRRTIVPLEEASVLLAEHTVENGAIRRDLTKVLAVLPLRQRRLIEDVRIGGFSLAEAAARNGFTEGAAKVSVHRSMKALMANVIANED